MGIINSILDYSKAEANKMDLRLSTFALRPLVEETLLSFGYHRRPDFELGCYMDPKISPLVFADQQLLRQVLVNLLGNAVKFTEHGTVMVKVLEVRTEDRRQDLRFEITDTGLGIALDIQSKLFETFSQVDSSETRKFGGTGLGLAYCRKIVELMGGEIGFTSEYGKGSTFWFTVSFETETLDTSLPEDPLKGREVVYFDDNKEMRFLLMNYLADWGMKGRKVLDLEDLWGSLEDNENLEFLILDEELGGISGVELAQRVQKRWPLLKILLLGSGKYRRKGIRSLSKPLVQSSLHQALEQSFDDTQPEAIKPVPTPSRADEASHTRLHYVEDNEDNRMLFSTYLRKWKIPYELAEDGEAGLEKFQDHPFDLILMDIQMPVMDGFRAAREIRALGEKGQQVVLVALTASTPETGELSERYRDFDRVLSKPIDFPAMKAFLIEQLNLDNEGTQTA